MTAQKLPFPKQNFPIDFHHDFSFSQIGNCNSLSSLQRFFFGFPFNQIITGLTGEHCLKLSIDRRKLKIEITFRSDTTNKEP